MKALQFTITLCLVGAMSSPLSAEGLASRFADPMPEFSPVPIWWWSGDRIERDRLKYELERIAEGGIHNAIILNLAPSGPLYGSAADDPPFLTEEWWDLFGYALQEAKRVGVRLWFYDQLGFSGAGLQARVVRDHPDFRGIQLRREVRDVTGPADVDLNTPPDGTPLAAFIAGIVVSPESSGAANWIWDGTALNETAKRYFRRTFDLGAIPDRAEIRITADNGYVLYVNGVKIGEESTYGEEGWSKAESFDVTPHLRKGRNAIAVVGDNMGAQAGLLLELVVTAHAAKEGSAAKNTPRPLLVSDARFRVAAQAPADWASPDFDDSKWAATHVIGAPPIPPWGAIRGIGSAADASLGTKVEGVRSLTAQIAGGRLKTNVPEGAHRVELFFTVPGGFDYHNPAAGAALIDVVHGEMERRFPSELGKGIAGSFQDEFPPMPRFSQRLIDEFQKRCGYNLLDCLPALYDDVVDRFGSASGPTTAQIRCDASRVAAELCEEAFFRPLHAWHERYGMLCGYDQTVRNADPIAGESYYVDYFKTMRHYSAPGNDHGGDAKPHQSIADLYERPRVWIEGFHSSGWGRTPEETVTLLHAWMSRGSTLYNPHAIYYSTHGSFYEWAPPDTGWRQPYFVHYRVLADYVSRLSYILTRGRHVAHVAVLHPASTVHAYTGFGQPMPAAQHASRTYWAAQESLRKQRIDYIIIDEDSIARAEVKDGILAVGHARLHAVILPAARVLCGATISKLNEFHKQGGAIVIVGVPPEQAADRSLSPNEFADALSGLMSRTLRLGEKTQADLSTHVLLVDNPANVGGHWLGAGLNKSPILHRRLDGAGPADDRDIFFVLSDDGTPTTFNAQYDINKRKLWELPAARGARLKLWLPGDGMPEVWDAVTGNVRPIYNYQHITSLNQTVGGMLPFPRWAPTMYTVVEVELADTPAPLVALRPGKPDEAVSIESDLQVTGWRRDADAAAVTVEGLPRLDATADAKPRHRARLVLKDGGGFEGTVPADPIRRVEIPGPFACRLEPTCDNRYGDFAWPPSRNLMPVEVRAFKYHEERATEDTSAWISPDFDDSQWETVIASYGPRAQWIGPIAVPAGEQFERMGRPAAIAGNVRTAEYSLKLGINEDPIYPSALGGKGRIPEEFIDLEPAGPGEVFFVWTNVLLPPNDVPQGKDGIDVRLRVGGTARKRVFLNDQEIKFEGDPAARVLSAPVKLRPGNNRLELLVARTGGRLRLFYHFTSTMNVAPDPQWIWSAAPSPTGKVCFSKTIDVHGEVKSATMVVALGDLHQIRLNGRLVADQGNFDPYFTGRSERYDITKFVKTGQNTLEIEARDTGTPTGMLLDGLVTTTGGAEIAFVSDASFTATPAGDGAAHGTPAKILAGPAHGYFGETATLLLRPRQHPLPEAGWLLDQPLPSEPIRRLIFTAGNGNPPPAWYRFRLPPGAVSLTLMTTARLDLYVNGKAVALTRLDRGVWARDLPEPDSPSRVAAIRMETTSGLERGAAIAVPVTFTFAASGRIPLGSWDELGLPHYCGGVVYSAQVEMPDAPSSKMILDLGRVRGVADVRVNGTGCGVRLWHPYRFDITAAAKAGANTVEIRVLNTLGPHFGVGHPSWHVFENQTKSGLFGPISVSIVKPVRIRLEKAVP